MIPAFLWLALAGAPAVAAAPVAPSPAAPPATGGGSVIQFRTDAVPRVDPVFGDVTAFRAAIDRFLILQGEMERVRDELSAAVHETLAVLAAVPVGAAPAARLCPASAGAPYARALGAGGRYLALGQQFQAVYRVIRRGDDLGETLGLTPDYRWKVKRARELHQQLLSDYREMRVAFYDQLGAELRHAGCKPNARGMAAIAPDTNPADPGAWELDEPEPAAGAEPSDGAAAPRSAAAPTGSAASDARGVAAAEASEAPSAATAPAIWIEIDNTLCKQPTRLSIDAQPMGEIGAGQRTSVRTRSGPHEICVLPTSDGRSCGNLGTRRKAYLHEGWALTVHCDH